jgi:hypothetical protein
MPDVKARSSLRIVLQLCIICVCVCVCVCVMVTKTDQSSSLKYSSHFPTFMKAIINYRLHNSTVQTLN